MLKHMSLVKSFIRLFIGILITQSLLANVDSTLQTIPTNRDATYLRPFITSFNNTTSIGGYAEGNSNYFSVDGLSEGLSFEMRRFNIFVYSAISSRIKMLAEIEFEHGTEEIALETAQIDFDIKPELVLRGGILLAPLAAFNQRHDSPLVSTQIIPSTLSLMGFGAYGKFVLNRNVAVTYDAYITNGLHEGIILNNQGRTLLKLGKSNELYEESNNGSPAFTGRLAIRKRGLGEIGLSAYHGVYNSYRKEGVVVDSKRSVTIAAVDYSASILGIQLQGETAMNSIDIPSSVEQIYGSKQFGSYLDIIIPVFNFAMLDYSSTVLNLNFRGELIDYNQGTFSSTGQNIYDDETVLVGGVSLRPTQTTVFRINYRYHWINDILGNASTRTGIQAGFATYF
jgi:hypothetical protein